jgi:hypothetical protein
MPTHIIIKLPKIKENKNTLKLVREKPDTFQIKE